MKELEKVLNIEERALDYNFKTPQFPMVRRFMLKKVGMFCSQFASLLLKRSGISFYVMVLSGGRKVRALAIQPNDAGSNPTKDIVN